MNISKLYRKDIEKNCAYCQFSSDIKDQTHTFCRKKGSVLKSDCCRKYKYSPLKRIPPKRVQIKKNANITKGVNIDGL